MNKIPGKKQTRRDFITSGTVAAASVLAGFSIVRNARGQNPDPIRAGLIGCGGRGTGAAENYLMAAPNVSLVALADLYRDRLDKCKANLSDPDREGGPLKGYEVTEDRCFVGFDAYKQLLDSGVDLVLLATPPGFRPIHFEYAVKAGKHVFAEKPVAVDPVGVRKFIEVGELAKKKGLAVAAGTQRHHSVPFIEAVKRVHEGQIGEILAARCYYNTGFLWERERKPGMSDMEWQTRNWYYFNWLSGDHIVEQHIHNLDNVNWVLDSLPVRCLGIGGRQVRTAPLYGNIYDHFTIDYEYPGGIHMMSMCRQMGNTDMKICVEIVGTRGNAIMYQDIRLWQTGQNPWRYRGSRTGSVVIGHQQEHTDMIESIRSGNPLNHARRIAESTLTAIMGRESAYSGNVVEWDEIMASQQDLVPRKFEFGPLPVRPVPMPGQYKG